MGLGAGMGVLGLGLHAAVSWGREGGPGDGDAAFGVPRMQAGEWGRGSWWGLGVSRPQ